MYLQWNIQLYIILHKYLWESTQSTKLLFTTSAAAVDADADADADATKRILLNI